MKKGPRPHQAAAARSPPPRRSTKAAAETAAGNRIPSQKAQRPRVTDNLQGVINNSGITTLVLDRDLALRFFTPSASLQFEITVADIGRPLSEVTRRFADDDLLLDLKTVTATGVSLWREVQADSGAWYNRRLLPYRDEDHEIRGAVITFADISEMKAVEREIDTARNYSNSIVDAIRQPLVVLDHDLRIVSASPSFYRSFAVKPGDAVGQGLPDLRDRCFDVQALRSFLARIATGHQVAEDYEIDIDLTPRGKRVLLLNARRIPAVPPEKHKTLLAIDDITERKRVEAALEMAKKQAERANLGKSRFLAAASHDLRQPLQTIFLMQGLLATKVKDPVAAKLVTRLGESMEVMSGLLNSLLDINQLEAGSIQPKIEIFPINALLDRLRIDFSYQAETKALICKVVASRQSVRSDLALLEQMIRNLISNALKYTDQGKVLVGCRRHGALLRVEVWDTGRGIPENEFEAIFEEFHQLDNPARERSRGLGLGLSIVQRMANLLGYAIDVRSQPGKGSMFAIEVPCAFAMAEEIMPDAQSSQPAITARKGETVLVVEDDPTIREMLQLLFDLEGYRTIAAADGASALALVAHDSFRPDIMVADYNLPNGPTGLDVAMQLRRTFNSALPVLIVTGDISTETLRAIAAANCIQLNKPIRVEEVTGLVRLHLAAPKPAQAAKTQPHVPVAAKHAPTVYLIDDDAALREAMRALLEEEGQTVDAFASCEAFLDAYRPGHKACLLVDARLPGLGGIVLLQRLRAEGHDLPSIVITGHGEVSMAVEAMKAGAIDFIEKPVSGDELLASIDRALALAQNSAALADRQTAAMRRVAGLTPREHDVMDLVIAGYPNKNIAADMHISQRTVENHRAAVMKKTGSKSLSDLVKLAITAA